MTTPSGTTVCVQFDGPIHHNRHHDGLRGTAIPGAINALRQLLEHHHVAVLTDRDVVAVAIWLRQHGIPAQADGARSAAGRTSPQTVLVTGRWIPGAVLVSPAAVRWDHRWPRALDEIRRRTSPGFLRRLFFRA